jgi:hypothetical protein
VDVWAARRSDERDDTAGLNAATIATFGQARAAEYRLNTNDSKRVPAKIRYLPESVIDIA